MTPRDQAEAKMLCRKFSEELEDFVMQRYAKDCDQCSVKARCSGLFAWYARGWAPAKITPFREQVV